MPRFSRILILAVALAVGALVACNDNHVTGPPPAPITPSASLGGPIGSYFLGVPPSGYNAPNDGTMADRGTGIIIPAYSRVVITVTGNVTATPNPDYLCCFEQVSMAYAGSWGPGGVGQAPAYYLRVKLGGGPTITLHYGDSTATSDTIGAPSYDFELHVSRNGVNGGASCYSNPLPGYPPGCTCPDGPCLQYSAPAYELSGGQTITVTRINDHLQLTASRSVLTSPDSVTFTASTDNGASFTVQGWSWKSDSAGGDQTAACTGSGNPCKTTVYRSGTMTVRGTVGGATRTASAHVTVTPDSATVTADSVDGVVGRTVTFHAGTRFGSPFTVRYWRFVPDSGIAASMVGKHAARPALNRQSGRLSAMEKRTAVSRVGATGFPECVGSTDSTCQEVITRPGTMYAGETIAGVDQEASIHVTASPPDVVVICTPSPVVRTASVSCKARLDPLMPFASAPTALSTTPDGVPFGIQGTMQDSDRVFDMGTGPALFDTQITVNGFVAIGGTNVPVFGQGGFVVTPRTFPDLQFPGLPLFARHKLPTYPLYDSTTQRFGIILGDLLPPGLDLGGGVPLVRAQAGPNRGFGVLQTLPPLARPYGEINDALYGEGTFAELQDGEWHGQAVDSTTGLPYCTQAALPLLRAYIERHEGATGADNSHYGIWQQLFRDGQLARTFEMFVFRSTASDVEVAAQLIQTFTSWTDQHQAPHQALDSTDLGGDAPYRAIGCMAVWTPE